MAAVESYDNVGGEIEADEVPAIEEKEEKSLSERGEWAVSPRLSCPESFSA